MRLTFLGSGKIKRARLAKRNDAVRTHLCGDGSVKALYVPGANKSLERSKPQSMIVLVTFPSVLTLNGLLAYI